MFGLLLVLLCVLFPECDELTTIVRVWHYSLMPCLTYLAYLSSSMYQRKHHTLHLVSLVAIGVHASWVGIAPVGMGGEDFTQASCLVSLISKIRVGCPVQHYGTME